MRPYHKEAMEVYTPPSQQPATYKMLWENGVYSHDWCIMATSGYFAQQISTNKFEMSSLYTPWKINMEPTNHPFRKEHELPNLHDYVPAVNLQGCIEGLLPQ